MLSRDDLLLAALLVIREVDLSVEATTALSQGAG
jgi:hypothetical protein